MLAMAPHDPATSYQDEHPEFKHLIQHNASIPFDADYQGLAGNADIRRGPPTSAYNSPRLHQDFASNTFQSSDSSLYPDLAEVFDTGLGLSFGGYGHGQTSAYQGPMEPHTQEVTTSNDSKGKAVSLSSPASQRTRSGRSAARSHSPHTRNEAASARIGKQSKAKKGNKNSAKTPQLNGPLSELTKDMAIPIRDMEEWVNRSAEIRQKEVEKRNGYVTRPMNSFMLYRSAYAERTKQYCIQNNHQVVSAVSGQSWPKEPESIRNFYNNLARIERDNHASAHPTYKFSPTKSITTSSSHRKGFTSDAESDADFSEVDKDPDEDWVPPGTSSKAVRAATISNRRHMRRSISPHLTSSDDYTFHVMSSPQQQTSFSTTSSHTKHQQQQQQQWQYPSYNAVAPSDQHQGWPVVHDTKPMLDAQYLHQYEMQLQQYEQLQRQQFAANPYFYGQYTPVNPYEQQSLMVGLPSSELYSNLHYQPYNYGAHDAEFQVDPMLLQFEHQQTPPMDEPETPRDAMRVEDISPLDGSKTLGIKPGPVGMMRQASVNGTPTPTQGLFEDHHEEMFFHTFGEQPSEFECLMEARHAPTPTLS